MKSVKRFTRPLGGLTGLPCALPWYFTASGDGNITLIETIQNYPTAVVEVEGDRLESAYRQLRRIGGILQDLLGE